MVRQIADAPHAQFFDQGWKSQLDIVDSNPDKWFLLEIEFNDDGKKYLKSVAYKIENKKYAGVHKYAEYMTRVVEKPDRAGTIYGLWVKRSIARDHE
jgi:hypothetical protein